ncbi:MAG: EamA family transporter [Proteobacteria bacterium]|nr:EamA family transporter [Pseudomonadota bacterium]
MISKHWLLYALITTFFWGVWGAFIGLPTSNGFPETLGYCVWALTMIPPAIIALKHIKWDLQYDKKSILYGCIIGFTGAGGQLVLFHAVTTGPVYLIFPIISLSPVITIALSFLLLKERTTRIGAVGIILALIAIPLFDYADGGDTAGYGILWFIFALIVMTAWGIQAFFIKLSNETMHAESIFFYMMTTGLMLVPLAIYLTDFSVPINWGLNGPYLAASIHILNSIGVLCLVYAFRYGKAIVVSPMINAGAPLMASVIAMTLLGVIPESYRLAGIIFAILAAIFLSIEPDEKTKENE